MGIRQIVQKFTTGTITKGNHTTIFDGGKFVSSFPQKVKLPLNIQEHFRLESANVKNIYIQSDLAKVYLRTNTADNDNIAISISGTLNDSITVGMKVHDGKCIIFIVCEDTYLSRYSVNVDVWVPKKLYETIMIKTGSNKNIIVEEGVEAKRYVLSTLDGKIFAEPHCTQELKVNTLLGDISLKLNTVDIGIEIESERGTIQLDLPNNPSIKLRGQGKVIRLRDQDDEKNPVIVIGNGKCEQIETKKFNM